MRSVWSGTLAFGLVSIPVKLGSAVSSHKISFRQIHLADQGRVRYQKTCELDEEVLTSSDIGRAFETPDDQLVEVTDADLQALPLPTAKTIEVSGFVEAASVDAMQLDTPYFLAPSSPTANKPYVLMREALARSGKAAVGKFAMRNSEHLALITARDDILLLQTLRWPDELNSAADAVPRGKVNISDNELQLADTLIDALGEADLSAYHDEYAAAVEALVTAKLEGAEPPAAAGEGGGGQVVDLMAALQASVDQAKDSRGDEGRHATVTELGTKGERGGGSGKRPAKKAAAKKTAAKKTTGGRSTAKKTAAKSAAKKTGTAAAKKASGHRKAN
ncbi:Ku protein [Streptomyces sp. NPDC049040]|uniref:non-homologous end joining protein Ku n=1 Tax=Streptomyces sp. NPDC049040 TaxID=3365593 RepID=UPI00371FAE3A